MKDRISNMVLRKIILTISLLSVVYSLPFDDNKENNSTEERGFNVNDIFKQINVILEQNIQSAIGDSSVEVGDNFTSTKDKGGVQITIEKFEYGVDKFPVTFTPDHDDTLEDDDIVPLEGDYDETFIFKEVCYDDDESNSLYSTDTTTIADDQDVEASTTVKPVPTITQSSKTVSKDKKLLNDAVEQPILTTV